MFLKLIPAFLALALAVPALADPLAVSPAVPAAAPASAPAKHPAWKPSAAAPEAGAPPMHVLRLPLNKSEVVRVAEPIAKIAVGNAEIADAVVLNARSFYVLGKKIGTTNVSVYGQGGARLLEIVDVTVGTDVGGVKAALHEILPDDVISVRSVNDGVALSGSLNSPAKVGQAVEIAKRFAPNGNVINDLRVTGSQQVMLQVKVAEMTRSLSKALNFKPFANPRNGNLASSGFAFNTLDPVALSNFATAAGQVLAGPFALELAMDALEQKGAIKILAEPNLIAMSGDTASFLAGGEFPFPVVQGTAGVGTGGVPTVTLEFKPFGVSLAFTPTVVDTDLINLAVAPEVSQLDKTNAITMDGFVVPGITTRRAKTTVELRDGQSFAIAGLLSSNFTDTLRGLPGAMDMPVLGALMRSTEYQHDETELVIIITPKLVRPAPAGTLIAPTDSFVAPSDAEIFLMGQTEGAGSGMAPVPGEGGLTGKFGHIIR